MNPMQFMPPEMAQQLAQLLGGNANAISPQGGPYNWAPQTSLDLRPGPVGENQNAGLAADLLSRYGEAQGRQMLADIETYGDRSQGAPWAQQFMQQRTFPEPVPPAPAQPTTAQPAQPPATTATPGGGSSLTPGGGRAPVGRSANPQAAQSAAAPMVGGAQPLTSSVGSPPFQPPAGDPYAMTGGMPSNFIFDTGGPQTPYPPTPYMPFIPTDPRMVQRGRGY